MAVKDLHARSIDTSTALSAYYVSSMIPPHEVVAVLNKGKIPFVLVGLHGLVGWLKEPRATQDVDVIVSVRHHKKAVGLLLKEFPQLVADDREVVTRLKDRETDDVLIDVMKPVQPPHQEVFKYTKKVTVCGETYRIPSLEMAMVMKFAPMISLNRQDEDKYQDAHDFILLVKANPSFDREKLGQLGELIYQGGGAEVLELARKALAGEKLEL